MCGCRPGSERRVTEGAERVGLGPGPDEQLGPEPVGWTFDDLGHGDGLLGAESLGQQRVDRRHQSSGSMNSGA